MVKEKRVNCSLSFFLQHLNPIGLEKVICSTCVGGALAKAEEALHKAKQVGEVC